MVFRIIKANQIKKSEVPYLVDTGQSIEGAKVPELDPNEDAFASEAFDMLSPEDLAGNGEKIQTNSKKHFDDDDEDEDENEDDDSEMLDNYQEERQRPTRRNDEEDDEETRLSPAARKSRHAAVLEKLRIKELELEALEEELRGWEQRLQEQEKELVAKDQEITQINIKKRQDTEAECNQSLKMAREAAESIKAAAKQEVEAIKKSVKAEAEVARQKGYQDGFNEGEEKGMAEGEAQGNKEMEIVWRDLIGETEMLIKELQTSRMGLLKASEQEILKLAVSFAKQILKVAPMIQSEIVLENINQAIYQISEVDKIVLKINLRDKAMCESHKDQLLSSLSGVRELQIIEDPSVSPGGVKIETGVSTIDATIETQARALEKALLSQFESSFEGLEE